MDLLLADFERERQAFASLLQPDCRKRILLLAGESGAGKTTLLTYCLAQMPQQMLHVPIQLRGSVVGVAEIFYRSGNGLGWDRLPRFTRQVADLQSGPHVQVDGNFISGINNSIDIVLQADRLSDRQQRRAELTEAWFEDLKALDCPALIALDTYEQAATEVKAWVDGPFLARVARLEKLRVLVAGQEVPEANNIEWGHCCETYSLFGVPEARHWLPVLQAMRRHIPFDDPLPWLAGVCAAFKGRPKDIRQFLEGLPRG